MKCDICEKEMESFHPTKERTDGIAVQVLSTSRVHIICNECAKKLRFTK